MPIKNSQNNQKICQIMRAFPTTENFPRAPRKPDKRRLGDKRGFNNTQAKSRRISFLGYVSV